MDLISAMDHSKENPSESTMRTVSEIAPNHIYQTMFIEGHYSDVTIVALGKEWKLHKRILNQSPYFASMFSEPWKEANAQVVIINIDDENITQNALFSVLGSLYCNQLVLPTEEMISVLATASFFQLKNVIDMWTEQAKTTLSHKNAIPYYEAASTYAVDRAVSYVKGWLKVNVFCPCGMGFDDEHSYIHFLYGITPELMTSLLTCPNLFPGVQELFLFELLVTWAFQMSRIFNPTVNAKTTVVEVLQSCFKTEEGKKFFEPFKFLKLKYLFISNDDFVSNDYSGIIPQELINSTCADLWHTVHQIHIGKDVGPKELNEEVFEKECGRWGQVIILQNDPHVWTYNDTSLFGLNFEFFIENAAFRMKRIRLADSTKHGGNIVTVGPNHNIMIKVSVTSLNDRFQIQNVQRSELRSFTLSVNDEVTVMPIETEKLSYPLQVLIKILAHTPA